VRLGIPPELGGSAKAPCDILADTLRGTKGIMIDRFRRPDKILEATERLVPLTIDYAVRQVHIGAPPSNPKYPYWMHCTGDIRRPTLRVGDVWVYEQGHLNVLDSPAVQAIADKYPGRPGLGPWSKSF
jgi:hypothetical protein